MIPQLYNDEWLNEEYVNKRRTLESIAGELGCNKGTVGRALRAVGIKARKRTSRYPQFDDREWLYNAYIVDKKSIRDIAREVGATMGATREHLIQKNIPIRSVLAGMREAGRTNDQKRLGEKGGNWRGGKRVAPGGYIYIYSPDHPNATKSGCVMEHRLVMEGKIGRFLEPHEVVHHKNGDKHDNHPDNLELTTQKKHISEHFKNSHEVNYLRSKVEELEQENAKYRELYGPLA